MTGWTRRAPAHGGVAGSRELCTTKANVPSIAEPRGFRDGGTVDAAAEPARWAGDARRCVCHARQWPECACRASLAAGFADKIRRAFRAKIAGRARRRQRHAEVRAIVTRVTGLAGAFSGGGLIRARLARDGPGGANGCVAPGRREMLPRLVGSAVAVEAGFTGPRRPGVARAGAVEAGGARDTILLRTRSGDVVERPFWARGGDARTHGAIAATRAGFSGGAV